MNGIVVASCSLADLLAGQPVQASDGSLISGVLTLPEYQRPYRWSEKELGRLLQDLAGYFREGAEQGTRHDFYLGSVILHQTVKDDRSLLNIIDGQQRLTAMAMLGYCWNQQDDRLQPLPVGELKYSAPESQSRIVRNLEWLKTQSLPELDFEQVNITLVVTRSEDDAYRFFETQNTGGVRLAGPDIIKAQHLRAVNGAEQKRYARLWEAMDDLEPLVELLMRGRYWQTLRFRTMASHRNPKQGRADIVDELAEQTGKGKENVAYRPVTFHHDGGGWSQRLSSEGYALRQPLNEGVNTIEYLRYFYQLQRRFLVDQDEETLHPFYEAYNGLVIQAIYETENGLEIRANGSPYLKSLYDSALLLYISQFGYEQLYEASFWLFRTIYSKRLSNDQAVKEGSVQAFVRDQPVLDWIASSFTHAELMGYLQAFTVKVSAGSLDKPNSVKYKFVRKVSEVMGFELPESAADIASGFDQSFKNAIGTKLEALQGAIR